MPVVGLRAAQVPSTFDAARSGGRRHEAADLMARRGTPVVAAHNGWIAAREWNQLGGRTVSVVDTTGRWVTYYAHLDRWDDGARWGRWVRAGTPLGTVGTSGNAPADAPHLHFQLRWLGDATSWRGGVPVDPVPALRAGDARRDRRSR